MFDYFHSSYELGEHFTNTRLHTKDIEEYGIGGTMSQYHLNKSGQLYLIDYSHTADFVELKEGDEGYNDVMPLLNFKWIPNGSHGKVTPYLLTKYIKIYPEKWEGEWEDWPTLKLHFRYGVLQSYESSNKI
jgi:hypothetical protein